jgi:hypothetical protein
MDARPDGLEPSFDAWTHELLCSVEHDAGRPSEARVHGLAALDVYRRIGREHQAALMTGFVALIDAEAGRGGARGRIEHALGALRRTERSRWEAYLMAGLACAEASAGDVDRARDLVAAARSTVLDRDGEMGAAVEAACGQVEAWAYRQSNGTATAARDLAARISAAQAPRAARSSFVRAIHRGIDRLLREDEPSGGAGPRSMPADLVFAADGAWFEVRGRERVELGASSVAGRMLARLVTRRLERAGAPVTVTDLGAAAWPDERVEPGRLANRVYVHLAGLRKRGLRNVLLRHTEGGYVLDPKVDVEVALAGFTGD